MFKPSLVFAGVVTLALATTSQATVINGVSIADVSSQLVTNNFNRAAVFTVTAPGLNFTPSVPGSYSNVPDGTMWLNAGDGCCGVAADTTPQITWNLGSDDYVTTMRVWNYNENLQGITRIAGSKQRTCIPL